MVLPAYGDLWYNGYQFAAPYEVYSSVKAIYGSDGATHVADEVILRVKSIHVLANRTYTDAVASVDYEIASLRNVLMQSRKTLICTYQGAAINGRVEATEVAYTAGTADPSDDTVLTIDGDVAHGPMPLTFNVTKLAQNQAVEIEWSVKVTILPCSMLLVQRDKQLLEFNVETNIGFNDVGASTITFKYHIKKWSKRNGRYEVAPGGATTAILNQPSTDIRNNFFAWFQAQFGDGLAKALGSNTLFTQTNRTVSFSNDYTTADVTIVFTENESDNISFPYTVTMKAEHEIASDLLNKSPLHGSGFVTWENTITAEIKVAPNTPSSVAWYIFWFLFKQRFNHVDKSIFDAKVVGVKGEDGLVTGKRPYNILTSFRAKENIFQRTHRFTAKYVGVYTITEVLEQSGIFQPVFGIRDENGNFPWDNNYYSSATTNFISTVDGKKLPHPAVLVNRYWSTSMLSSMELGMAHTDTATKTIIFDPCSIIDVPNLSTHRPLWQGIRPVVDAYNDNVMEEVYYANEAARKEKTKPDHDPMTPKEKAYLGIDLKFSLMEDSRSHVIGIQHSDSKFSDYRKSTASEKGVPYRNNDGAYLYGKNANSLPTSLPKSSFVTSNGGSHFILNMSGYICRIVKPAAVPTILAYKDQTNNSAETDIVRVGKPMIRLHQLAKGETPLYLTQFSINYMIPHQMYGDVFQNLNLRNSNTGMA